MNKCDKIEESNYASIQRELGTHGQSIRDMKDGMSRFGEDMKEVKKDVSELKTGHGKIETKLDTLIDTVKEHVDENKIEHQKNQRMRWALKWVAGIPAGCLTILAALKAILSKAGWAKLTGFFF